MSSDQVYSKLVALGETVQKFLQETRVQPNIQTIWYPTNIRVTFDENFQPSPGFRAEKRPGLRLSRQQLHRIVSEIAKTNEFKVVDTLLKEISEKPIADRFVSSLVTKFLTTFEGDLSDAIKTLATTTSKEVSKEILEYRYHWFVDGLLVEETFSVDFGDWKINFIKFDESFIQAELFDLRTNPFSSDLPVDHKSGSLAIEMVFNTNMQFFDKVFTAILRLNEIIPLFKPSDIKNVKHRQITELFDQPDRHPAMQSYSYPKVKATIFKSDIDEFKIFLKKFYYSDGYAFNETFPSQNVRISFARYLEAIKDYDNFEKSLSHSIMALEALYTVKGDNLNYTLKQRISKLMNELGTFTPELPKLIGLAYTIRSNYVHGEIDAKSEKKVIDSGYSLDSFKYFFANLARCSLATVILSKIKKDDLLLSIDNAMIVGGTVFTEEQGKEIKNFDLVVSAIPKTTA